jgi:hypothetical protein
MVVEVLGSMAGVVAAISSWANLAAQRVVERMERLDLIFRHLLEVGILGISNAVSSLQETISARDTKVGGILPGVFKVLAMLITSETDLGGRGISVEAILTDLMILVGILRVYR